MLRNATSALHSAKSALWVSSILVPDPDAAHSTKRSAATSATATSGDCNAAIDASSRAGWEILSALREDETELPMAASRNQAVAQLSARKGSAAAAAEAKPRTPLSRLITYTSEAKS